MSVDKAGVYNPNPSEPYTPSIEMRRGAPLPSNHPDDYIQRQIAVEQVAKADPDNIQEVAASQLAIINSYYQSGLKQSQQSFFWSLIWGGVGIVFLIAAISFSLLHQTLDATIVSGVAGAIVEVFAGTYLYLYKHASDQLAKFRESLETTEWLLLANSMCEKMDGDAKQTSRAEIIRLIVQSATKIPTKEVKTNP